MPLVMRGNNAYFYRCFRRNGRVRCEYVASGATAARIGRLEALERDLREARRRDERAERARLEAIDREQAGRFGLVEALVRLTLASAGFHRHKRGEWRRRRRPMSEAKITLPVSYGKRRPPAPLGEIRDVLTRAAQGDVSAMPRFVEIFDADPEGMIQVCGGDLAGLAETTGIDRLAGRNLALKHALAAKLAALRAEVAGPEASPVERLLAQRVALCWQDVHDWDIRHNVAATEAFRNGGRGLSDAAHEHYQKMRDRAHRRYLWALKALAAVQKLGPAIQINLAKNQVNMAGGPAVPGPPGALVNNCPDRGNSSSPGGIIHQAARPQA